MGKSEFNIDDVVTFQAYAQNEPITLKVLAITSFNFKGEDDGKTIYYHLGHYENNRPVVTNQTTGKCIRESKLFDLQD